MAVTTDVTSVVPTSSTTTSSSTISNELNKYDFLKILASELQNQDPSNPMDSKDFIAQLAQFSSLEQMQNMNTALGSLTESLETMLITQSASLIGKNVVTEMNGSEIKGIVDSIFIEDSIPYAMIGEESVPVSSIRKIYNEE